jgi:aspartate/glutamate racemase
MKTIGIIGGIGPESTVILDCTELPLIIEKDAFGIPLLNTTAIHVESIVGWCSNEPGRRGALQLPTPLRTGLVSFQT